MDDPLFMLGMAIRLIIIIAGFVAMWSLWVSRRDHSRYWSPKLRDIWWCHMSFVTGAVLGNVELFYRHVLPTFALSIIAFGIVWTLKAAFEGDVYTIDGKH